MIDGEKVCIDLIFTCSGEIGLVIVGDSIIDELPQGDTTLT